MSKNKFKFVNGTIGVPQQTEPTFDSSERCNTMIVSWITTSLTQQIAQSIVYIDNAQDLWEDLKERLSKGDHFRTSDLLQEIHSMRQADRTVSVFHTDMKTLWDDLDTLRAIPNLLCSNDSDSADGIPAINQQRLLFSSPTRKNSGKNITETSNKGTRRFSRGGSTGNYARTYQTNNNKICVFCGNEGPTVETCYFKHEFPPNFKFKSKNATGGSINTITSIPTNNKNNQMQETRVDDDGPASQVGQLTIDHEHNINHLNQEPSDDHPISGNILKQKSWILDSGATVYVTNGLSNFACYKHVKPIYVKLPNNMTIMAKHSGTIRLSDSLSMFNTLYISGFKYNIVSIHKLATSLQCKLVFDNCSCIIQDMTSSRMIGYAEATNNLYILIKNGKSLTYASDQINQLHNNKSNNIDL
ncbi:PREDICTED: uncharacterized protein LOC109344717 [Lupinus angustifolius]|uniref:uncharacterized protein LOC109344717 n=1 Tax=Lupinus angustifolius TaxID=3871 RepID=UPI00092FC385|nr:PREDICTED: uncharacterized protein LOC109344717 [Lupinus angustifolius]